jgi:hypothetical protein
MLDKDLAEMYGVKAKRLKEAVRRNISRFPDDFIFELSALKLSNLRSQFRRAEIPIYGIYRARSCHALVCIKI